MRHPLRYRRKNLERVKNFEISTSTLAMLRSASELHPHQLGSHQPPLLSAACVCGAVRPLDNCPRA